MIKFEHIDVVGWEHVIRGMRNPKNSWEKSDSLFFDNNEGHICKIGEGLDIDLLELGGNDHKLMMDLAKGGPVHAKYRRMITVYMDITAPLYWWKEFDTYKVGTVANSCSTMHKIHAKEFTGDDFSHEYLDECVDEELDDFEVYCRNSNSDDDYTDVYDAELVLGLTVKALNHYSDLYLKTKDKRYWYKMIQLLPTSYNQKRTVMLNYEVLTNIYHSRKNHKLDEWHVFCDEIEKLPYSEIITGGKKDEEAI